MSPKIIALKYIGRYLHDEYMQKKVLLKNTKYVIF
jgi:hypothetical protein